MARYSYDAWGACTILSDTTNGVATINPFRYRGYYFDTETNFYYLQSRYYDPQTGRFINTDEPSCFAVMAPGTLLNAFAYCGNNPVNDEDISGRLAAQLVARIIVGAMIGFFVQLLSDLIAVWAANIVNKPAPSVMNNGGEYISSMLTWALTCVSFNSKVVEIIATLLPVIIKQVSKILSKTFEWIDFLIDIAFTAVSFIVSKFLGNSAKNKLIKIKKKAGNGSGAWKYIQVRKKKLDLRMTALGIKFNLGINITSTFASYIYNVLTVII